MLGMFGQVVADLSCKCFHLVPVIIGTSWADWIEPFTEKRAVFIQFL